MARVVRTEVAVGAAFRVVRDVTNIGGSPWFSRSDLVAIAVAGDIAVDDGVAVMLVAEGAAHTELDTPHGLRSLP